MTISERDRIALSCLGDRSSGGLNFIGIAAGEALTRTGLARRTRQGWAITPAGAQWLQTADGVSTDAVVIPFSAREPVGCALQ